MASPNIAAIRLTESGSFDPEGRDTLIVGPGMGTAVRALYGDMARYLTHRFQIIGIDLPGHGESPAHPEAITIEALADAVAELVTNLRVTGTIKDESKVYFAGLSVSGLIALQLALEHADLFNGIAVMASSAAIGTPEDWAQRAEAVEQDGTESMVEMSASLWVAHTFTDDTKLEVQKRVLASADDATYAALCRALGAYDVTDRLGEIDLPIFTVAGDQDQMCTIADAEQISTNVKHGSTAVVEDAAHLLPLEHPKRVAELLDSNLT